MSRNIQLTVCSCLFCMLAVGATGAQDRTFRVDSYIPERFVDFVWRLNGGVYANGSEIESNSGESPLSRYLSRISEGEQNSQNLSFGSSSSYNYVTVPQFLESALSVNFRFDHSSNENDYRTSDTSYESHRTSWDRTETDYERWSVNVLQYLAGGIYLTSDYFVKASLRYDFRYNDTPSRNESRFDHDTRTYTLVDQGQTTHVDLRDTKSETGSDQKSHRIRADLLLGWGRIYQGHFASTAIYMVEELSHAGLLEREPTYDEMLSLTDTIYYYRQRHAIDTRLHRIEALTCVLTYLASAGVISDPGPYGHLVIQDVWDYFPGSRQSQREFGYTIAVGPGLEYSHYSSQRTTLSDITSFRTRTHTDSAGIVDTLTDTSYTERVYRYEKLKNKLPFVTSQFEYHKPLSRRWQFDGYTEFRYFIDAYNTEERSGYPTTRYFTSPPSGADGFEEVEYREKDDYYDVAATLNATYIHDSRTSLRFSGQGYFSSGTQIYSRSSVENPDLAFEEKAESWNWSLSSSLTYRIAVPTTLKISLSYGGDNQQYDYNTNLNDEHEQHYYRLSASIYHYIY